ncbi:WecB/TagA/CpsF family glycosyltransferase [Haloferula sp. A504]|uniref:WecB/TagA/CpsF family glycosyltransferase n=1 Tax=Haloferula sp. A504 TaxID=3373601 RepID=UPI0031BD7112|nr:WecB/TagA/CpsF family glycosyltransferase [Verrucomicrobiaceae bacterium E54]
MLTRSVIGLPLACTDYAGAIEWILSQAFASTRTVAVEAANTHVAAMARHDPEFRKSIGRFDLIVPDGMPLVWSLNLQLPPHEKLKDRVYGPTLMRETLRATDGQPGFRHFLLGGAPETLEKLEENFARDFPRAVLAGSYSPPFGEWPDDEFDRIHAAIEHSGANLIWVGLGCPKQEHWIARHKDRLPSGVYFGIGAAFAFHAGEVSQAPPFLQKNGLEWLYRLAAEPRRLFKRYVVHNSLFLFYSLLDHAKK